MQGAKDPRISMDTWQGRVMTRLKEIRSWLELRWDPRNQGEGGVIIDLLGEGSVKYRKKVAQNCFPLTNSTPPPPPPPPHTHTHTHTLEMAFDLWLIEQGTLHLQCSKWLENRGLSNRGDMTSYPTPAAVSFQMLHRCHPRLPSADVVQAIFNREAVWSSFTVLAGSRKYENEL